MPSGIYVRKSAEDRFWAKVQICVHGMECVYCCWEWIGAQNRQGYGSFWDGEAIVLASRMSLRLKHGRLDEEKLALHWCDNPPCVNDAHLYAGTYKDNGRDMRVRGRSCRGEDKPTARLSVSIVEEMRTLYAQGWSLPELAQRYDVGASHVSSTVRGKKWATIPGAVEKRAFAHGEHHAHSKVTWAIVRDWRERYARGGVTYERLAKEQGVTPSLVCLVINNRIWQEEVPNESVP
jgi:hypothetical protein